MRSARTLLAVLIACPLAYGAIAAHAAPYRIVEGFDDDFAANRNVPDLVDPALSSPFTAIDGGCGHVGVLTVSSKTICDLGPPCSTPGCVGLDFTNGGGSVITFHFPVPMGILLGAFVDFEVGCFGGDGGSMTKSVSTDGVHFTQVGDDSDGPPGCPPSQKRLEFLLPASFVGQTDVYFQVQIGTAAGIYDGIGTDNFGFTNAPEPSALLLVSAGLTGLARHARRRDRSRR